MPPTEKQRQHRFAQYLDRYSKRRAPIGLRELVVPFGLQPCLGIGFTEAAERSGFGRLRHSDLMSGFDQCVLGGVASRY